MGTIKILHTADWHLGALQNIPFTTEYKNRKIGIRLFDIFERIKQIVKFAIKNRCKYFLITGDIFDNHAPNMFIKKYFSIEINKLLDNKIHVIILIGNHDTDGIIHALNDVQHLLNHSKYLHIIDKYKILLIGNIAFHCIPYKHKVDYEGLVLKTKQQRLLKKDYYDILLAHLGVQGADAGAGVRFLGADVSVNQLSGFHYVALGHYHLAQKIGASLSQFKANQIYFAGSIIKLDMKETTVDDKKSFNWIKLSGDEVVVRQIALQDRQYLKLKIDFDKLIKIFKRMKDDKKIKILNNEIKSNSIIYLIVTVSKADAVSFNVAKFIELFKKIYGVLFISIVWNIVRVVNKVEIKKSIFDDVELAFDEYMNSFPPKADVDNINKIGHKLITSLDSL